MKTVPSVHTLLINTLYLSLSTKVVEGIVFRKHTVAADVSIVDLYILTFSVQFLGCIIKQDGILHPRADFDLFLFFYFWLFYSKVYKWDTYHFKLWAKQWWQIIFGGHDTKICNLSFLVEGLFYITKHFFFMFHVLNPFQINKCFYRN